MRSRATKGAKKKKLAQIAVRGVVQGVGFRPFIYRLAHEHKLAGWVRNSSGQVDIEVEGPEDELCHFIEEISSRRPPMARIEGVTSRLLPPKGLFSGFVIEHSLAKEGEYQLVSPDIATCDDCRRELFTPEDRRFRYPFTNCTNCGPRFTIIEDIPYDRPKTTMHRFIMCPDCQREYDDPLDRRFHAQPNACPRCGPQLTLTDREGNIVACEDVVRAACELLRGGKILAIKGLGGFLLACDSTRKEAIELLRARKKRGSKPFAVMLATLQEVTKHCLVSAEEETLLTSPGSPIVLVGWRADSAISREVAPGIKYLGVMLPYTPLHHVLLREVGIPLVMTSGNLSEEPIAKDNDEALRRLKDIADYFLLHDRDIFARYDDSVYLVERGKPRALRRARGYAPYPIFLPFKARQILACGAQEKNTFCLTKEDHAFVSQHIGDMENEETLEHFDNTLHLYEKLFRVEPEIVAYDLHPEYLSTKYALELTEGHPELIALPVQHHHAHIASCLAENGVVGPAIGVALDGTGFGTDGTIWGGEFLIADCHGFQRVGHLEQVPLVGGEAAIRKPYRMALSYLYTLMGKDFPLEGLPLERISATELDIIRHQLERRTNSPLTSSAGRLFDAVSALVGLRGEIDYEAQAAIDLEMAAPDNLADFGSYPFSIAEREGVGVVRLRELLEAVVGEVRGGVGPSVVSARFHNTVAAIIAQMCCRLRERTGINEVALSGGCFQNRLLLRLAVKSLEKEGFRVFTHSLVPTNDGCISLGQAVIAHFAAQV